MKIRSRELRSWPVLALVFVSAATAITLISVSNSLTLVSANEEPGWRTLSRERDFPNYDIRGDAKARPVLDAYRQSSGRSDGEIDSIRKQFYAGEKRLREKHSNIRIEYNTDLRTPGLIAGDTGSWLVLSGPSKEKRAEILRSFIKQNEALIGLNADEADDLQIKADYTNPDGNLSYARLKQFIGDVPVFRSEIKAAFTKKGEMFRIINNLAPALDENVVSREFGEPKAAVENAFKYVSRSIISDDITLNDRDSSDLKSVFGTGGSATVAEKMYFPTDPGVVRPSWRVLIWQSVNAYYVIVDAETGTLLWRKNLTSDQTQSATYSIYSSDSPGPLSPSNSLPGSGIQGPSVGRTSITLIGNEAPNLGQNNLGWITDGNNTTDGNNVEAGTDLTAPDGVDAPVTGSPNRVFNFAYDPPPGGGDSPTGANYRNGAVTNLFYWCNRYHDLLYSVGFTEAAGNFQNSNFGRGGAQNDRLRAEVQDFSGTNNANFTTPADGSRPKMQMYLFTGPTPQRDSSLDAEVFLHELTHGVSSRIIGNGTGLTTLRGQSLGEGWSDFFARLILATQDEDINGIYPAAGYSTLDFSPIGTDNFYYGIRRFPYALKTARGGVPLRPFNPLTFADIDIHQADVSDGAFPASPLPPSIPSEEHNAGEVWCMALLEVRSRVINDLGFVNGSKRMAQLVVDGMKLSPANPDFIQARDAIIAADESDFAGEDLDQIWAGFASRGMGFGATDNATTLAVEESFLLPNAVVVSPFSVSDATGDNDGSPEPGEHVTFSVTVTNTTGTNLSNVVVTTDTGTLSNYGSFANGATKTRQIPYTIPFTTGCGGMQKVELKVTSSEPGANVFIRRFRLGVPPTAPQTFSNTNPISINDGLATAPAKATPYGGPLFVNGLTGSKVMRLGFTGFSHTFLGDVDMLLVGPNGHKMIVMSDAGGGTNLVNTDFSLIDSASDPLPISGPIDDGGEYQPANYDTADTFPSPAPAGPYPSPVTSGTATFGSVFGTDASQLNGTWQIYIVDDFGGDAGSISGGWYLKFESSDFVCSFHPPAPPRADFDGDGRSDVSVQRPSDGSWFAIRSSDGVSFTNTWGNTGDVTTPGDFDGDGKTDLAVYRASSGQWFVLRSSDSSVTIANWGNPGDVPEIGDFDGDGKTDITVYRPSTGVWYSLRTVDGGVSISGWGNPGDVPVPADFDGDGKTDVAVYRPSTGVWYSLRTSDGGVSITAWGQPGDKPVEADYDGDGKDDFGVYRPSDNNWYILNSAGGVTIANWGNSTDVPVPGDYDGDGKSDIAVFRTGNWYILNSTGGVTISALGRSGDVAIPTRYLP